MGADVWEPFARNNQIDRASDPRLRAQIASEVGKLQARKKFGLVFERPQNTLPRSRKIWMAWPRLFCVAAQSRGTRPRVRSLSASV